MKKTIVLMSCAAIFASCNKGPQVNMKNATSTDVAQAIKTSGVMTGDDMIRPGEWASRVKILQMDVPGMPADVAQRMKTMMADRDTSASKHCLTPSDVKKPKEDFFTGENKSCRYEHFTMGAGKIDIAMVCKEQGAGQTTKMSGTYTPTRYSMDVSSSGSGGSQPGMTMKMHVDAERVGECSGKDG
jgi:hypothetical protein